MMRDAPPPAAIGRYQIVREIGRGAMGIVYEARDSSLMRPVALKTLSLAAAIPEEGRAQFEKRFYQEARAAAGLQHPCIVVVYEIGTDPATAIPYMALEYLRGRTLDRVVAEDGRLPWTEALRLVGRLADALQHAHAQGVVHRDMKPANVMVLASGEPKIMDFGVAKLEASQLTAQGQIFGSPSYMAPEQALDARTDSRCDIFSLGSLLHEMLTGERAFPGRGVTEIVMRLAREDPRPPSERVPDLPAAVDAIVARALVKDPAGRYPTAQALAEDIGDALAGRAPRHLPGVRPATVAVRPGVPVAANETYLAGRERAALALPPGKRVSLAFLSGPRGGEVQALTRPSVLIGRQGAGGGAGIELADGQVSRTHAVVECHGARIVVRDLQSTNGTLVDGQRIQEQELEDRAEFQVGSSRLMLIVTDAD
jgi:hypothetical protein